MSVENKPISKLQISELNVRKDAGDVSELALSIEEQGILQPLLVRPENGKYGIVIGSRRFTAAKLAKLKDVPVIVREMDDDTALIVSLAENIQRNDLQPIDTAEAIHRLLEHHDQKELSEKLAMNQSYLSAMHGILGISLKLEKAGSKVLLHPSDQERASGKGVPVFHAIKLSQVFRSADVANVLQNEPNKDVELVQKTAKNSTDEITKIAQQIKKTPDLPVDTIIEKALEPSPLSFGSGGGDFVGRAISMPESETKLWHNKLIYNLERNHTKYDFYTIGYSGTEIDLFIERLKAKQVKTLIDVRKNPISFYKPEFSKGELSRTLKENGIDYFHQPEWGVDKELREDLNTIEDYEKLWVWYDKNILGSDLTSSDGLPWNFDDPWAFMCTELDPTKCHRHRIAKHLEENFDMKGMDL